MAGQCNTASSLVPLAYSRKEIHAFFVRCIDSITVLCVPRLDSDSRCWKPQTFFLNSMSFLFQGPKSSLCASGNFAQDPLHRYNDQTIHWALPRGRIFDEEQQYQYQLWHIQKEMGWQR
jgi:hypothetical protein